MKPILFFTIIAAVLAATTTLAENQYTRYRPPRQEKANTIYQSIFTTCTVNNNAPLNTTQVFIERRTQNIPTQVQCAITCILHCLDLIGPEGYVNEVGMTKFFADIYLENRKKVLRGVKNCKDVRGSAENSCENGFAIFSCFVENNL